MFYLVLVLIKFSFIHICTSDGIHSECIPGDLNTKIILLESNNYVNTQLNDQLIDKCGHIYDFEIRYAPNQSVYSLMEARGKYGSRNVIYLNVDDYYNFNHIYLTNEGLAHAGDLAILSGPDECSVKNDTEIVRCNYNNVKMVTDSVTEIDGGHLYNFITEMEYYEGVSTREDCDGTFENSALDTVLICSNGKYDHIKFTQEFCPLRFKFGSNCNDEIKKYENKLLAVLTSIPIKIDNASYVPTVFYDVPFMYNENDTMFLNSVASGWRQLKYPILTFLQEMQWRKVAIITDDSLYSVEFEEELTQLFRDNVIMYTSHRCEERTSCYSAYKNILPTLQKEAAKIIIANFDKKYIEVFKSFGFKWIVRDYSFSSNDLESLGGGYVVTLAPAGHDSERYKRLGLNFLNDGDTKIVENIKHIHNAYHQIESPNNMKRNEFYRELSRRIKKSQESMDFVSSVVEEYTNKIYSMNVTKGETSVISFSPPIRWFHDVPNCSFRSNNYFSPCNDTELILIMLVVILFATTLLLVTVYFHKSSPVHAPNSRRIQERDR